MYLRSILKKLQGVITIKLNWAKKLEKHSFFVIPGWKLCSNCFKKLTTILDSDKESASNDSFSSEARYETKFSRQAAKRKLEESLTIMEVSPVASSHSLPKHARVEQAKKRRQRLYVIWKDRSLLS